MDVIELLLVAISVFFTWLTARGARNTRWDEFLRHRELLADQRRARREEAERHAELLREQAEARLAEDERRRVESEKEAKRRREEATQRRQTDLGRRLERVALRLAEVEELRWQMLDPQAGQSAITRTRVVLMRLRTAVVSSGVSLPKTQAVVDVPPGQLVPSAGSVADALDEVEQSLHILAAASRVPWESESE